MKHIKLFENWAEELEVPEYLNPDIKTIPFNHLTTHTIFYEKVKESIEDEHCALVEINSIRLNLQYFSECTYWLPIYREFTINQSNCKYKLQSCDNIPKSKDVHILGTDIKTMKGIESRIFSNFSLRNSQLENLKYCPEILKNANFKYNPLLSYYNASTTSIEEFTNGRSMNSTLCGKFTYSLHDYGVQWNPNVLRKKDLNDAKLHANIFCAFESKVEYDDGDYGHDIQPWHQIYHDPNDVENFEFLFIPFWKESENFREKAQEYLGEINLTGVTRSKEHLW